VETTLHRIHNRLDIMEEKMSELDIITTENIQGETEKKIKTK
jgi:hypothetical protein